VLLPDAPVEVAEVAELDMIKLKDSVPDVHRKGRTLAKTENEVTNGLEMRAAKLASLVDPSPM
jgi:hypothetical protein